MEPFFIAPYLKKRTRLKVTQTYATSQVKRFTVSGKNGEIQLQKILIRKSNQWQLLRGVIKEEYVLRIAAAIDWKLDDLEGKHKPSIHPKNVGW